MKPNPLSWSTPALCLAVAGPAGAGVLVVDSSYGPGTDYGSLQQAVNAAADGDTLLVRDGDYTRFTIIGKGLTLVAEGEDAFVDGFNIYGPGTWSVGVWDLAAGQQVLVRGLTMNYGVSVQDCEGPVWFDDLSCSGGAGICAGGSSPGVDVRASHQVTLTGCSFVGEVGHAFPFTPPVASPGLRATASTVVLYDTALTGGQGESVGTWPTPQPGAAGVHLDGSTLTIVGCTIVGGGGGVDPGDPCDGPMAQGGPGVLFDGAPSTIRSAESTAAGGATSLEPLCPGQAGPAGPAIAGTGTIAALSGYARHLQANSPVRGGETLTFAVEGLQGEVPVLLVSPRHRPLPLVNYSGVLLVALPQEDLFVLPALPAGGTGSLSFPVPDVGPAVGSLSYYVQALFLSPAPALWLGAGTTVVLLHTGL